jgi:hypothetical protein
MQYALLFYHPPATEIPADRRDETILATLDEMRAWQAELERAGVFRSTLGLAPAEAATSLRGEGGKVIVTDGPHAETKEILGGLAFLDCADLDEALRWAKRCPILKFGIVEVRPEGHPPPRK